MEQVFQPLVEDLYRAFDIWVTSKAIDSAKVVMKGELLKLLLDDRHTIVSEPLKLSRNGRDVVIYVAGEERGRMSAETVRDLVQRSIRLV